MRRRIVVALLLLVVGRAEADDAAFSIDEPDDGAVVGAKFRVTGRVPPLGEKAQAVLRVNGADVSFQQGRFESVVSATEDGPFRIRAVFAEIGAPASVVERNVTVDATPPEIQIDPPTISGDEATVRGVARDAHLTKVQMNEKDVAVDGGVFEGLFLLPASGTMTVTVEALDAVGNRAQTVVHLDRSAPTPRKPLVVPPATSQPVEEALRWLAAHQSPDGSWGAETFRRWCDGRLASDASPEGAGKAAYDVGVTGLALLAFVRAGYSHRGEDPRGFNRVVGAALRYLKYVQDAEGCFGSRTTSHFTYNHAIATLAMVEAYGMTGSSVYKNSTQKALDFISVARNPYFAWRYGVKPGDNDTSVTGWMTMALESAKLIDAADVRAERAPSLMLDEDCFEGIKAWIEKMTDPDSGRVGYQARGTGPARPTEFVDRFPAEKSESMTGVGLLARIFLGENPKTSDPIKKGAELCAKLTPAWNPNDGSIDMYYWYYATEALSRVGGEPWSRWRRALRDAVIGAQHKDTDYCMYKGSWDNIDPWGPDGGRVYSTAILALALEVADRSATPTSSPPPKPPPSDAPRIEELRGRIQKWVSLRQNCALTCPQCEGHGKLRGEQCGYCRGRGYVFDKNLHVAYFDMRSPTWRSRPTSEAEFKSWYERVWRGELPSPRLKSFKVLDVRVEGDRGTVAIREDDSPSTITTTWVWDSESSTTKGTWWLESDGH